MNIGVNGLLLSLFRIKMNRIYIEITRTNREYDLYRFEPEDLIKTSGRGMFTRAISFMENQLLRDDIKEWIMRSNCRRGLNPEDYDVIED